MLQRRIGTMWTSSGWSVPARPRVNSRTERSLRLVFRSRRVVISERSIISGADHLPRFPHRLADPEGAFEDGADAQAAGELVAADRAKARRGHAPAILAVGRAA